MSNKSYLDHRFPVIQHTAIPARLDKELKNNVDKFLPRAVELLEQAIVQNGGNKKLHSFFRAHHMAIVLTPSEVLFCLDVKNATLFMTALYCFELKAEVTVQVLDGILKTHFDLNEIYYFKCPREFINSPETILPEAFSKLINDWYHYEVKRNEGNSAIMKLSPKVFKNTTISVKQGYCFVIMPFLPELTEIYEDCIKIAVKEAGMECKRADDIFHNTSIMEVIWTEICSSEIIIADLTGKNPNVFYELGIAHTLGKETIMLTQNSEDVPFDLRHLKYIEYTNTGRGIQELKRQLMLTIETIRGSGASMTGHM